MGKAQGLAKLSGTLTTTGTVPSSSLVGGGSGGGSTPTITTVGYPGDDTAVNTAGGDTVTLTGTNFNVGIKVVVNSAEASVVTRVSSTQITFAAPANPTGSYIIYVVNTDGSTALGVPGLQYSPTPTWTTAAGSLGSYNKLLSFSTTLISSGDAPITYGVATGSLPSGITLNASTGVLSGTTPDVVSSTTYSFTVRATDAQKQDTDRAFSITILPLIPPTSIDYLIVAGGGPGGGGQYNGGGGGAGGLLAATGLSINTGTPYTITVGAGGTGVNTQGTNGTNSQFGSLIAIGGGAGGAHPGNPNNGLSGGSGGGGSQASGSAGAGTAGQGNAGAGLLYAAGGGGGGKSAAATTPNGGAGYAWLNGTYYAGGGGGGGRQTYSIPQGLGGIGGGGNGGLTTGGNGDPGSANTGGGGGGVGSDSDNATIRTAGSGGSGVVIIRYADTYSPATSTTGSPTITVAGGYRVYKWTTSGSITF